MIIRSGNDLPAESGSPVRQVYHRSLCAFLERGKGICVIQGPGLTGEAELLRQGCRHLLEQGVGSESIRLLCGEPGDNVDDLILSLQEHPQSKYIFVDRAERFSHLLGAGDFLRAYVADGSRKLVLGGQSPPGNVSVE